MTTYADRMGGTLLQVAYPSLTVINLNANKQLSWANQYVNTDNVVAYTMEVVPDRNGWNLILPDATFTSEGQAFILNNPSAFSFNLVTNSGPGHGGTIFPIPDGDSFYFYLLDNTTADGTWRINPFAAGGSVVLSVAAMSGNDNLVITGSPIISAGTFTFNFALDLLQVVNLGATAGLLVRSGTHVNPTWGAVTIIGDNNINVVNGGGPANPTLTLAQNVTNLTSLAVGNLTFSADTIRSSSTIIKSHDDFSIENNKGIGLLDATNAFTTKIIPGAITANNTLVLPIAAPTAGQFLKADAVVGPVVSTSWAAGNAGTVTRINSGTGLSGGPIVGAGTLSVNTNNFCQGRLTLVSNTPVADVANANIIFYTPYLGNYVSLYTAGVWTLYTFTQLSIAVPNVGTQAYDVYLYSNGGPLTLFLDAWANDTTRGVGVAYQDGVLCMATDPSKRYLGFFRTLGAGQTDDTVSNRNLINYYNRVQKTLFKAFNSSSWTFPANNVFRQMNSDPVNQLGVVSLGEDMIRLTMQVVSKADTATGVYMIGWGESSTTVVSANSSHANNFNATTFAPETCTYTNTLPPGYYSLKALEQLKTTTNVIVYTADIPGTFNTTGTSMQGTICV